MTLRGVCRILMVAIMLLGPGLSQLFHVNYVAAAPPDPGTPAPVTSSKRIEAPGTASSNPPGAGVTCSSAYSAGAGSYFGVAGRVTTQINPVALGVATVELLQVDPNNGNATPITDTVTSDTNTTDRGYFAFNNLDLGNGTLDNITLRVKYPGYLTEYYDRRYSPATATLLTITRDNATGGCIVTEKGTTRLRLGSAGTSQGQGGNIALYVDGGIAGRVTVPNPPPASVYGGTGPAVLDGTGITVTDALVEVLTATVGAGGVITSIGTQPVQSTRTDIFSDGYYRVGGLGTYADPVTSLAYVYVVRFSNLTGYSPNATDGYAWWRDGNLPYPYSQYSGNQYSPNQYITKTITINPGTSNTLHDYITTTPDSYIVGGSPVQGINGHLIIPGRITGKILDGTTNTPVSNARAELYDKTGTVLIQSATVDINGVYQFSNLAPGFEYRVKGYPATNDPNPHLVPRWYPSKDAPGDPVTIPSVQPGDTNLVKVANNIDITLVPGAKFTGVVSVAGTGALIAGVVAQVYRASDPIATALPIFESQPTGANGVYNIPSVLEPGTGYRLGFRPGTGYAAAYCGGTEPLPGNNCTNVATPSASTIFTFSTLSEVKIANIALNQGKTISGVITAADGNGQIADLAAAGVKVLVSVYDASGTNLYQTFLVTPAAGATTINYTTAGLQNGTYKLLFSTLVDPANTGFVPAYYADPSGSNGSSTLAGATGITIDINNPDVTGKSIQLKEGVQITLNLLAQNPLPPPAPPIVPGTNIYVELYAQSTPGNDGVRVATGTTDPNTGKITFYGVPFISNPNSYALKIIPANNFATTWVTDTNNPTKATYALLPGISQEVTFTLQLGGSISGKIYDPNNANFDFSSTVITVYDSSRKVVFVFNKVRDTNSVFQANGFWQYRLNLLPGSYYLGFEPPSSSVYFPLFYQSSPVLNTGSPLLQLLSVQTNQALSNVDALFLPKGKFQVKVVDGSGLPIGGANIKFYYGSQNPDGTVNTTLPIPNDQGTTDASGIFLSNSLTVNNAQLSQNPFQYKISANGVFWPSDKNTQIVDINDFSTNIDLSGYAGTFRSIIITLTAKYQASGKVTWLNSSNQLNPLGGVTVEAVSSGGATMQSTTTDAAGNYLLDSIPSGYKLRFTKIFNAGFAATTIYSTTAGANPQYGTFDSNAASTSTSSTTNGSVTFNRNSSIGGQLFCLNNGVADPLVGGAVVKLVDPADASKIYGQANLTGSTFAFSNQQVGGTGVKVLVTPAACGGAAAAYYVIGGQYGTALFSNASAVINGTGGNANASLTFVAGSSNNCSIAQVVPSKIGTDNITLQMVTNCFGPNLTIKVYQGTSPGFTLGSPVATTVGQGNAQDVLISGLQPDTNYYFRLSVSNAPTYTTDMFFPSEILARTAASGKNWYFPFGDTRSNGTVTNVEFLHILNYGSSLANVTINYYRNGASPTTRTVAVQPNSRLDVEVSNPADANGLNAAVAGGSQHATAITSDQPIMVERSIYNTTNGGLTNGGATNGGTVMPGSPSLNYDWTFADGTLDNNLDADYWLFNPGTQPVCLLVKLYQDNGSSVKYINSLAPIQAGQSVSYSARALAQNPQAWGSAAAAPASGFAARFTSIADGGINCASSQYFVAEQRILYNNNPTTNPGELYRKGETHLFGSIGDGQQWFFMEGLTDKVTSRKYVLLNPSNFSTVVTLTSILDNPGSNPNPAVQTVNVPAYGRAIVDVADLNARSLGRTYGFTVKITSDQAIVAQRAVQFMWRQRPMADGMFDQLATNRVGTTWLFAAGSTMNDSLSDKLNDMAINVYNPGSQQVYLKVTYYYGDGAGGKTSSTTSISDFIVDQKARLTIAPGARPTPGYPSIGGGYKLVAVKLEALDGQGNLFTANPIFAERLMYWTYGSTINGGNAVYGYNPPGL